MGGEGAEETEADRDASLFGSGWSGCCFVLFCFVFGFMRWEVDHSSRTACLSLSPAIKKKTFSLRSSSYSSLNCAAVRSLKLSPLPSLFLIPTSMTSLPPP